jgi:hypothetical protein
MAVASDIEAIFRGPRGNGKRENTNVQIGVADGAKACRGSGIIVLRKNLIV